jgi:hypothetical protein
MVFFLPQIQTQRALVSIQGLEGRRAAIDKGRPPFAGIITVRLFDLDHFGAQIAQYLPCKWRSDTVPQFDDNFSR